MLEAAATAFASILVLGTGFGLGGYMYHKFYKWLVLHKIEKAFKPGDPVLELAALGKQMPTIDSTLLGPQSDETHVSEITELLFPPYRCLTYCATFYSTGTDDEIL
jgi:hypothetical protein